ncbi:MAG TPA: DUF72 domain-containing protein [Chitinophagaceae bacterium]|nr:DUF72 domain-containing protein [Chitinophagaceae bacterium]
MRNWWIGCSGFHYKHWRNIFYPEGMATKNWFGYYCEQFNAVELNVTFYRFPQVAFLKTFHKRSPDDFRFAVKAPRAITHYKKFVDSTELMNSFYDTVNKGLKQKLGCILFQLHPRTVYSEEKMEHIISCLDPAFPNVIEFRHQSWWIDKVYKQLSKHNITFCGISHPTLPDDIIVNNPLVYYRFHGTPELYKTPYNKEFLEKVVATIKAKRKSNQIFLFFNNDIDVNAPRNARETQEIVKRK